MLKKLAAAFLLLGSFTLASAQTAKKTMGGAVRRDATVAGAQATSPTNSPYTTYDFNWSYTANLPACAQTNNACWDGFQLVNSDTKAVVANQGQMPDTVLSYSYVPAGGIPYGTTNWYVVAHGYDANGASVTSGPSNIVSITVATPTLAAPIGVTGKYQ